MGDDLRCPSATARARRCNGRPSRTPASPSATSRSLPVISERAVRLRARQRRRAAPRPELAAQLDRAHHPHAQGGAGDRLGRLRGAARPATRPCWRCATTGATTRCCSCTTSTREPREIALRRRPRRRQRRRARRTCSPTTTAGRATDGKHRARARSATAIAGTASAGSTTCSSAARSEPRERTPLPNGRGAGVRAPAAGQKAWQAPPRRAVPRRHLTVTGSVFLAGPARPDRVERPELARICRFWSVS